MYHGGRKDDKNKVRVEIDMWKELLSEETSCLCKNAPNKAIFLCSLRQPQPCARLRVQGAFRQCPSLFGRTVSFAIVELCGTQLESRASLKIQP